MTLLESGEIRGAAYRRLAVIGAGAWGTALALTAARAGREATLWRRSGDLADRIRATRRNDAYLPGVELPPSIRFETDLAAALRGAEAILLVVPSAAVREMAAELAEALRGEAGSAPIVLCAKGIEPGTGLLMSEIVAEALTGAAPGHPVAALSGPTFAAEVAAGLPTAVAIASEIDAVRGERLEESVAARLALTLQSPIFRPYVSDDLIGVEIGGALKNVIAIACGAADGLGLGANMRAALITRGLEEMKRLSEAMGGERETVTGLAGLGDLALTCGSDLSRNLRYGRQLAETGERRMTLSGKPAVVEGARNAVSVTDLARAKGLSLPICEAVRAMIHDAADPRARLEAIWTRPIETEGGTGRETPGRGRPPRAAAG